MSKEEAVTEMVIAQLRARLPSILSGRDKAMGKKIVLNMPPGNLPRVDIEFPPDIVRVGVDAQRA